MIRAYDLRQKEVINIQTAERLGFIYDVEINADTGIIDAIIIPKKMTLFGFPPRKKEYIISWNDIIKIGADIILVDYNTSLISD